jgi:hypothetical protein
MKFGGSSTEIVADANKNKKINRWKIKELLKMASSLRNGRWQANLRGQGIENEEYALQH